MNSRKSASWLALGVFGVVLGGGVLFLASTVSSTPPSGAQIVVISDNSNNTMDPREAELDVIRKSEFTLTVGSRGGTGGGTSGGTPGPANMFQNPTNAPTFITSKNGVTYYYYWCTTCGTNQWKFVGAY
jgi:hypothetical protein